MSDQQLKQSFYPICLLCPLANNFSPSKSKVDCNNDKRQYSVGQCDVFDDWIKTKGKNHPIYEKWRKHQLRLNIETKGRLLRLSPKWKILLLE